jgi:hypothetical protein
VVQSSFKMIFCETPAKVMYCSIKVLLVGCRVEKKTFFFHFREKRKSCENEVIFAKFRKNFVFAKVFAKIFVFVKVFAKIFVFAKMVAKSENKFSRKYENENFRFHPSWVAFINN